MKTEITLDNLTADGWELTSDPAVICKKPIKNTNPLNRTPEDTDILLVIHRMYNTNQFAVLFPYGGMLNFNVQNMEELKAFESAISFYDCPY